MSADGQMPDAPAPVADAAQPTNDAPPVNDALMARLDEMQQQLGKLQAPAQQQEPQWQGGLSDMYNDPNGFDPNQGFDPQQFQQDPYQQQFDQGQQQFDPSQGYDPYQQQQVHPAQAAQELQQYISSQVQDGIRPFIQSQKANQLEQKYPDIAENPNKWLSETEKWANRIGKPELAREPEMIELVYKAQMAEQKAAQETPADGGDGVHLESGGAAPQQEEVDPVTRMLQSHNKAF